MKPPEDLWSHYITDEADLEALRKVGNDVLTRAFGIDYAQFSQVSRMYALAMWARLNLASANDEDDRAWTSELLRKGSGMCGSYARIFVSLARAQGFNGRVCQILNKQGEGHLLAEVFLPAVVKCKGPLDSSNAVCYSKWVAFDVLYTTAFMRNNEYVNLLELHDDPTFFCREVNHGLWNYESGFFSDLQDDLVIRYPRPGERYFDRWSLLEMGVTAFHDRFYR